MHVGCRWNSAEHVPRGFSLALHQVLTPLNDTIGSKFKKDMVRCNNSIRKWTGSATMQSSQY